MNAAKTAFKALLPSLERGLLALDHAVSGYVQLSEKNHYYTLIDNPNDNTHIERAIEHCRKNV